MRQAPPGAAAPNSPRLLKKRHYENRAFYHTTVKLSCAMASNFLVQSVDIHDWANNLAYKFAHEKNIHQLPVWSPLEGDFPML